MVTKNKKSQKGNERTKSDSIRWIVGLSLLFIGLFITAAVFFYYFSWKADQSILMTNNSGNPHQLDVQNPCGSIGVKLAELLVGRSFGIFGILIPIMIIVVGIRIIRQRSILANHTLLSMFFVTILGSLTLGIAFGDKMSLFSSTGLGGAYGIAIGDITTQNIGPVGAIIIVLLGWILVGVFINRKFINTVNTAGQVMIDRSEEMVDVVKQKVVNPYRRGEESVDVDTKVYQEQSYISDSEKLSSEPISEPEYRRETSREVEPEIESPRVEIEPESSGDSKFEDVMVIDRGSEPAIADELTLDEPIVVARRDSPFTEMTEDGEIMATSEQPRRSFLSRGRVVMGSGGIVELNVEPLEDSPSVEAVQGDELLSILDEAPMRPQLELQEEPQEVSQEVSQQEQKIELDIEKDTSGDTDHGGGIVVEVEDNPVEILDESAIVSDLYDPLKDLINYRNPPVSLLEDYMSESQVSDREIYDNKSRIEETLKYFGIPIQKIKATVGPTVTLYEIVQAHGVKISKIQGLENDIAQSLKAFGIRIIAPIPGKGTIGIEVPNRDKQVVSLSSAIRSAKFQDMKAELPIVVGRTIQNENYVFDLAKMPHLLVAGATGQGKSVGLNVIITSLLYKKHPSQLKFVLIDPKMVEFSLYAKLEKYFLAKMESEEDAIITDPKKAVNTLNSLCLEMDNRLELCKRAETRNIAEYNAKFVARRLNPNKGHRYLPYIVVVVDEFADLIMTAREVEAP